MNFMNILYNHSKIILTFSEQRRPSREYHEIPQLPYYTYNDARVQLLISNTGQPRITYAHRNIFDIMSDGYRYIRNLIISFRNSNYSYERYEDDKTLQPYTVNYNAKCKFRDCFRRRPSYRFEQCHDFQYSNRITVLPCIMKFKYYK